MKAFAQLFDALDASTSSLRKLDALVNYLRDAAPEDAAWAVYLLAGGKPRQTVPVRFMREVGAQAAGLAPWLFPECYDAVGDLASELQRLRPVRGKEQRDLQARPHPREVQRLAAPHRVARRVQLAHGKEVVPEVGELRRRLVDIPDRRKTAADGRARRASSWRAAPATARGGHRDGYGQAWWGEGVTAVGGAADGRPGRGGGGRWGGRGARLSCHKIDERLKLRSVEGLLEHGGVREGGGGWI